MLRVSITCTHQVLHVICLNGTYFITIQQVNNNILVIKLYCFDSLITQQLSFFTVLS